MHNERYSILYSSATGNTRLLADTIRAALPPENLDALIENFDRARTHPDADDLDRLRAAVLQA